MFECPCINYPTGVEEGPTYACVFLKDAGTNVPKLGKELLFLSGAQVLGSLSAEGRFEIKRCYACDGYSPVWRIFGKWVKVTPVPKKAGMFPAGGHDLTRQFLGVPGCPWTKEESDLWFREWLLSSGEPEWLVNNYYGAVSGPIGNVWTRMTRKHQNPNLRIVEIRHATFCQCPNCNPVPQTP